MEWINEKTERQNRKKNIIIKGLDVDNEGKREDGFRKVYRGSVED